MSNHSDETGEPVALTPQRKEKPEMAEEAIKNKTPETPAAAPSTPSLGFDKALDWVAFSRASTEAFFKALQGSLQYDWARQEAGLRFAQTRFEKNVAFVQSASQLGNPQDLVRLGVEHGRIMIEDYLDQSQAMADLTRDMIDDSLSPLEEVAQATIEQYRKAA